LKENAARPEAVSKAKKLLEDAIKNIATWETKLPHITDDGKQALLELVEKAEKWMDEKATAQESIKPTETPVFDSKDAPLQLKNIRVEFDKLMKKPKPPQPKEEKVKLFHINVYSFIYTLCLMVLFLFCFVFL
jgi:lysyl-tRNA synthetase class I